MSVHIEELKSSVKQETPFGQTSQENPQKRIEDYDKEMLENTVNQWVNNWLHKPKKSEPQEENTSQPGI